MVTLAIIAFLVSLVAGALIVRGGYGRKVRYDHDRPQRFHSGSVSRLGGAALVLGAGLAWVMAAALDRTLVSFNVHMPLAYALMTVLVCLPAVLCGISEDLTQRLRVSWRLGFTGLTAGLACVLLDVAVPRLDIAVVDGWMVAMPWVGVLLAFLAICGLPHAFNIIDGYNGLAGFVALAVCIAIVHVALQVGDRQLAATLVCLAGAPGGFLVWNYPRGLLFAGDGGAYLWGVVIAMCSIRLVQRNPDVSSWFPMLLLIYPVWETLFSIYRKAARGSSPGVADALHFHQLIYRRIVRGVFHDDASRRMLMRNNRTSPYLWGFTLLTVLPALVFWQNTHMLMAFCGLFVLSYLYAYISIVRFKVPRWLRR
jgi:UDP-GlcNAc:undecaprenyl-phosphate GlcNAc-1-phosphate transferase